MDFEGALRAVLRSRGQVNLRLKSKQKEALEAIAVNKRDCLIVLPTGYGKSLIYQLLPSLCDHLADEKCAENNSIVIVVSPLNAIIDDQLNKLNSIGISCTSLRLCGSEVDGCIEESLQSVLKEGKFHIIFVHPEVAVSNRQCRELFLSKLYQENVVAIVVDEAHCIIEW